VSGRLAGAASAAAYRAGWAAVRLLPESTAARLFAAGADLAARHEGKGVRRLRANYARVTGRPPTELDDLVRAGVRSYARYWCEVFRLPSTDRERVARSVAVPTAHRVLDARAQGRGVILVLGHMGNWDVAAVWLLSLGCPFTTVAERLEPASLFDAFVAFRESLGMEVIPLTGGQAPPFEVLAQRLRAGGVLCLLADRDLSAAGVGVDFFGARATMPAGPAALALATGAALLPTLLSYVDGEGLWASGIAFEPPVPHTDVATMTQQVAASFERAVGARPQDWHMLQRLWSDDLEPRPGRG